MKNPVLYKQLRKLFGEVLIAKEDMSFVAAKRQGLNGKARWEKVDGGEEYHVCCPICGDTRFRLFINHMWGRDREAKLPASKLVICHNERCDSNDNKEHNVVEYLRRKLRPYFSEMKDTGVGLQEQLEVVESEQENFNPLEFPKSDWGSLVNKLPKDHPAHMYLGSERSFDINVLANKWGVFYADQYPVKQGVKDYSWLAGRIFIPTSSTGWQARSLEADVKNKYVSCPGWKKSKTVYNIDNARQYPYCVVQEGVTDVWRVGSPSVCIFGKSISQHQVDILAKNFDTVILMLDPDAYVRQKRDGNNLPAGLKSMQLLKKKILHVHRVDIVGKKDAALCTYDEVWSMIEQQMGKIQKGFKRPLNDEFRA